MGSAAGAGDVSVAHDVRAELLRRLRAARRPVPLRELLPSGARRLEVGEALLELLDEGAAEWTERREVRLVRRAHG